MMDMPLVHRTNSNHQLAQQQPPPVVSVLPPPLRHVRTPSWLSISVGSAAPATPQAPQSAPFGTRKWFDDTTRYLLFQVRLLAGLTVQLLRFLRPSWLLKVCGLVTFSMLLTPAFVRVAWFYVTSRRVKRNIMYGAAPRNTLDLYLPDSSPVDAATAGGAPSEASCSDGHGTAASAGAAAPPVVIFVTGGMWIIGYKAWGALLASRLRAAGCVVACLDYRNFPQGTVTAMVDDVTAGIAYVLRHAKAWGGDPERLLVVGQSAGAHISAIALLQQAERERTAGATDCVWPMSRIAAFVGVSGVYTPDDPQLLLHFERQGLSRAVVHAIMEAGLTGARAQEALPRASPASLALGPLAAAVPSLPPVMLCHGTADKSAPATQSAAFGAALRASGAAHVMERYYQGKSHTDPFLEDPIAGGSDALLEDILTMAFHGCEAGAETPHAWPVFPRMLPDAIIQMARRCIPF